jgi:hypothetical protein
LLAAELVPGRFRHDERRAQSLDAASAIIAELSASAALEPLLRESRQRYASTYRLAIEKFTSPASALDEAVMIGVIGAAGALTREAASGRLKRLEAIRAISHILLRTVTAPSLTTRKNNCPKDTKRPFPEIGKGPLACGGAP